MRTINFPVALAALLFIGLGTISCTNENGAAGTTDGTSAEGYELRSEEHLATPMDSTAATMPDTAAVNSAAGEGGDSGE